MEPPAFCYAVADNFEALKYYRLDVAPKKPDELLQTIKAHLAAKIPAMFGAFLPQSVAQWSMSGGIPYPVPSNPPIYGHAMVAVGYNDDLVLQSAGPRYGFLTQTRGALLVRNSWGPFWGRLGYGWLPYDYVLNRLTGDWWCLISSTWVDLDVFERAAEVPPCGAVP
jgi:C1A family cysteine protease